MGLVTPDFGLIFWMLVSFGVVLFILKKFVWKPVLKTLKDRENSITDSLDSAKKAREEMSKLQDDNKKILSKARAERDELLKDAKTTKDNIIRQSELEAKEKANKIIANAQLEIENQKNKALAEIKEKVAELSIDIAEKVLKRELKDEKAQSDYVGSLIEDIKLN